MNKSENILLEGRKLIDDAFESGVKFKTIYYDYNSNLDALKCLESLRNAEVPTKVVSHLELQKFSQVVTSSGVIAVAERPHWSEIENSDAYKSTVKIPMTLVLDRISDPGNAGTIIRTAAAVGAIKVLCIHECVNMWDSKVVRSGTGAHFKIPVIEKVDTDSLMERLKDTSIFFTEASKRSALSGSDPKIYSDVDYFEKAESVALFVGSEAHGYTKKVANFLSEHSAQKIVIPMAYNIESLNSAIASSIASFEIRRQYELKFK